MPHDCAYGVNMCLILVYLSHCIMKCVKCEIHQDDIGPKNLNGKYYSAFPPVARLLSYFSSETGTHSLNSESADMKGGGENEKEEEKHVKMEGGVCDVKHRLKGRGKRKKGKNFFRQFFFFFSQTQISNKTCRVNLDASGS